MFLNFYVLFVLCVCVLSVCFFCDALVFIEFLLLPCANKDTLISLSGRLSIVLTVNWNRFAVLCQIGWCSEHQHNQFEIHLLPDDSQ